LGRFNLRKLNELDVRKQYQIKISNRYAALGNLNDSKDTTRALKNLKVNIKTSDNEILGLYKLKLHKPWFDKECLGFLDQRKQAKVKWLQDPNLSNVHDLNNVGSKASRHFRNKKKEHLKAKIDEFETNIKIKKYQRLVQGHP
jgi:hypothetical protein